MKCIKGIYLPDTDTHFEYHLTQGPEFMGKGTYQFKKIKKAFDVLKGLPGCEFNVAVDVGAHVGLWSRPLSHWFKIVHAFEPMHAFRECLVKNVSDTPNEVKIHDLAVTAVSGGVVVMNEIQDNTGQTHIRPASLTADETITKDHRLAVTTALDDVHFATKIDFIKIDVEGFELEVLSGAHRILTEDKPIVVLEQKGGNAERYGLKQLNALKYIMSLGYEIAWEMSGDYCVKPISSPT